MVFLKIILLVLSNNIRQKIIESKSFLKKTRVFMMPLIKAGSTPLENGFIILVLMMNSSAFLAEARSKAAKSINQANINATVMRNMTDPVTSLPEQQQLVERVRKLEQQIAEAQAVIASAPARKQAILQKYL